MKESCKSTGGGGQGKSESSLTHQLKLLGNSGIITLVLKITIQRCFINSEIISMSLNFAKEEKTNRNELKRLNISLKF